MTLSRWQARLLLAALALLMGYGAIATFAPVTSPRTAASPMQRDADLYRTIAQRVAQGENYYVAASAEQRMRGYPLKPFVTVRPPLLAEVTAAIGGPAPMGIALQLLVFATLIALIVRLRSAVRNRAAMFAAIALAALSLIVVAQPDLALWHEVWAAVLVTLALALYRPDRWWPSVIVALVAALTRELAIPFLLVMGFAAGAERRWREAAAWGAALALAAVALALHAHAVSTVVTAMDPASPGWSGAGGWPFVITMMAQTSAFALLPLPLVALALPLALAGWAAAPKPMALRATLWLGGMMAVFMVLGRPDNFYWGMILAPLLPIGLAFAPNALASLARAAR